MDLFVAFVLVVIIDAGLEHALVHAAERAAPVIGKILKFGSGSNAVIGITFLRIIGITTGITKIFLHGNSLLSIIKLFIYISLTGICSFTLAEIPLQQALECRGISD